MLANPTGQWNPPVSLHVDRTRSKVRGYMAVYGETSGYQPPLLAQPAQWDSLSAEEQKFEDAEKTRLLYVAATRAGTELVVTRKASRNNTNYWGFFAPYLKDCPILPDPGPGQSGDIECVDITAEDVEAAADDLGARWQTVEQPTYATAAAKQIAMAGAKRKRFASSGEHGTEWGTVIHLLLETAMLDTNANLDSLARSSLQEHGLNVELAGTALETVKSVMASELWTRARASKQVLVEVPFSTCPPVVSGETDELPTVLRGVIDLAFREPKGWVLVDYKTDAVTSDAMPDVVAQYQGQVDLYARCWEQLAEEPVCERGLFLTDVGAYVKL
jgi:ATP-dependent helicase/nuclease subunit A